MFFEGISTEALCFSIVVLFLISAFFSGSETALMCANRYQLAHLKEKNHAGAIRVLKLLENPDRLIGLILLFNNLTNILITQITTLVAYRHFGNLGIAVATGILTFTILVFAELAPKTYAAIHSQRLALPAGLVFVPLLKLTYPLVWLINSFSNSLLRLFGFRQSTQAVTPLSSDELRAALSASKGHASQEHHPMMLGILDLEKRTVKDIMIPRNEIVCVDLADKWNAIEPQLRNTIYTLLPVCENDINNALGFVHVRDVLKPLADDYLNKETLKGLMREPFFVSEQTLLLRVLLDFKRLKKRMALVVNEYGDVIGLVSLEDLLEEVVGEFTNDPATYDFAFQRGEDEVIVDGGYHIKDLNRELGWKLDEKGSTTINGLILEYLETIPKSGTSVMIGSYSFEILKVHRNAVKMTRVRAHPCT